MGPGAAPSKASIDFRALAQWTETGTVCPRARPGAAQRRRYRLGRWQSRSTSSWNPPVSSTPATEGLADIGSQSLVSIDISRKPSESRRSSVSNPHLSPPPPPSLLLPQTASPRSIVSDYEADHEDGPLAQMLLQENDEIWNNPDYRFTFYSPATGTVRANDVHTLCTDRADGLDALMRQALGTGAHARTAAKEVPPIIVSNDDDDGSQPPTTGTRGTMPQLSVTSADSVLELDADAAAQPPDNVFL
ncbi:hypothetical protein H4R21_003571, partial [Coemansia helicoidea]